MRRTARAVADDDEIGVERFEGQRGVLERLAFFERRGLGGKIYDVGGKPLRRQFKTDARPRGRLDEQIYDGFAAQGGNFFNRAFADGLETARGVQHGGDFFHRERFDVEQMFFGPAHFFFKITSSSAAPDSVSRREIFSSSAVGTFLPTKSALIGSSRWPRSTSTASWIFLGRPKSFSASIAARVVRPLNSTSSTSTTVLPFTSNGMSVG